MAKPSSGGDSKAIDQAASESGGVVEIPAGTWRSGSIFLKQGVALHLAENALLLGSNQIEDYPKMQTRIEGHFLQSLENGFYHVVPMLGVARRGGDDHADVARKKSRCTLKLRPLALAVSRSDSE